MNVERLREVINHMCSVPERCDMDEIISHGYSGTVYNAKIDHLYPYCGTVGCIAGWTFELNKDKTSVLDTEKMWDGRGFAILSMRFAQWWLDLTFAQASRLFSEPKHTLLSRHNNTGWPIDLAQKYVDASLEERPAIIRERAERFIATHGEE